MELLATADVIAGAAGPWFVGGGGGGGGWAEVTETVACAVALPPLLVAVKV